MLDKVKLLTISLLIIGFLSFDAYAMGNPDHNSGSDTSEPTPPEPVVSDPAPSAPAK